MSLTSTIKTKVIGLSNKGPKGELLYTRIKFAAAKFLTAIWSNERYACWFYHLYTGRDLNLKDPQRFDEKLWWLKLYNHDPQLTICSDKYAVRGYVKEQGYEDILIPQYDVLDSVDQLDVSKYNQGEVIIKCTHNSGGQVFWNPAKPTPEQDLKAQKKLLAYTLKQNQYVLSHEWNYKDVPHRLVVEKVIRDKNGMLPLDYKFMCFDGEPKLLFLDVGVTNQDGTYNHDYPRNIYDMDFNLLPVYETRPNAPYEVQKPENWDYMVEVVRALSQPFPHCRVDLYNVDGRVYFGEITFYHGGGCNDIQPEEWDYKMGSWIDIKSPKVVREG